MYVLRTAGLAVAAAGATAAAGWGLLNATEYSRAAARSDEAAAQMRLAARDLAAQATRDANGLVVLPTVSAIPGVATPHRVCRTTRPLGDEMRLIEAGPDGRFAYDECAGYESSTQYGDDRVELIAPEAVAAGRFNSRFWTGVPVASSERVTVGSVVVKDGALLVAAADGTYRPIASGAAPTLPVCDSGYIGIPNVQLPSGKMVPSFCVAQRLMPLSGVIAAPGATEALVDVSLWTGSRQEAIGHCASSGASLISDDQYLAIAHWSIGLASNWALDPSTGQTVPRRGVASAVYLSSSTGNNIDSSTAGWFLYVPWATNPTQCWTSASGTSFCNSNYGFTEYSLVPQGMPAPLHSRRWNLPSGDFLYDFVGWPQWTSTVLTGAQLAGVEKALLRRDGSSGHYANAPITAQGPSIGTTDTTGLPVDWFPATANPALVPPGPARANTIVGAMSGQPRTDGNAAIVRGAFGGTYLAATYEPWGGNLRASNWFKFNTTSPQSGGNSSSFGPFSLDVSFYAYPPDATAESARLIGGTRAAASTDPSVPFIAARCVRTNTLLR